MASKIKPFPIAAQAGLLKSMYPGSVVATSRDKELTWQYTLRPSPLGDEYAVKIVYMLGSAPKVYVLNPFPLTLANGAVKLPHVYDQKKQRLCLYYPDGKQWNKSMPLAKTIVWWIYEWLYHYEIWLGTEDEWKGGSVHPFKNEPKIEESTTNDLNNKL
jgi:hypothetical protein